jgi:hypothetical protein
VIGTRGRRVALSLVLALLGPLPLPHVDRYLPLALGLFAAAQAVPENGPLYLALMAAVWLAYAAVLYAVLAVVARARGPRVSARS